VSDSDVFPKRHRKSDRRVRYRCLLIAAKEAKERRAAVSQIARSNQYPLSASVRYRARMPQRIEAGHESSGSSGMQSDASENKLSWPKWWMGERDV
jgi:hypothetical protein